MAGVSGSSGRRLARDPHSASPSRPATASGGEALSADPRPETVLLVEDNPTDVFIITELLHGCGLRHHLEVVRDGEKAIAFLQKLEGHAETSYPRVVLLDLNIPKVKGLDVLRSIRSNFPAGIAVVVITSSDSSLDRSEAQRLGADAYFRKPNSIREYSGLAGLVERFLSSSQKGES